MRIGITYTLKSDDPLPPDAPDDFQEEFDSPVTIEAIAAVLRSLGHDVEKLGDGRVLLQRLLTDPPELVFNFSEGYGISRSREARVPAVLEMLGIPYTGSDPMTLAVTLDKAAAKQLVEKQVAVPRSILVDGAAWQAGVEQLAFPVIVKPAWEGSSKGIRGKCLVDAPEDLPDAIESLHCGYRQPVLVEEFIEGDELTVGIVGNCLALDSRLSTLDLVGIMRVMPAEPTERFVYSVEVKRDFRRLVRYECPPPLPEKTLARVAEDARMVYRLLGCRDFARVDFRLRDGIPYFLEVNPLPGLNPESSDLVIMARLAGWTYEQLIETILQAALKRLGLVLTAR